VRFTFIPFRYGTSLGTGRFGSRVSALPRIGFVIVTV